MQLKDYQIKTLEQVKNYLTILAEWKKRADENTDLEIDFTAKAWEKTEIPRPYISRKNGIGEFLPNFCLKIPTGGGKTLLAVKTIDLINQNYLKRQTGMVLWIVPTTQIYRQTTKNLVDRSHPYRQHLDMASGGKTLILEKTDRFTPQDLEENLVVLMLMLPAANRQTREALKVFKDNGFVDFFPPEDDILGQKQILEKIPNLDTFGEQEGFFGRQIKTSLGNALRVCKPVIILDEGQKAYSVLAQETLRGFNPSMIVELSATPLKESNILVEILGIALNREEMIKLDLHVVNKADVGWKETLTEAIHRRIILEKSANQYESNSGNYIRPICVIQAERTGRDQRSTKYVHSEDVKEYLIKVQGIVPEEIAIKTSEKDELKEVDDIGGLMSHECPIRYIITKQALQEGWDCPFAYVLAILTNPTSKNALTQLVGRILRQPYARKTRINELDESYVYCYQQRANDLLSRIKLGFEHEGLGDLQRNIITEEGFGADKIVDKTIEVRDKFGTIAKNIILPVFVVKERNDWREVNYENNLVPKIDWGKINLKYIKELSLSETDEVGVESIINMVDDRQQLIERKEFKKIREQGLEVDPVFVAKYITDIIPNPWVSFEIGKEAIDSLIKTSGEKIVVRNFVYVIEELRKLLIRERDRLAEEVFKDMIVKGIIRFLVIGKNIGFKLPDKMKIKTSDVPLTKSYGEFVQKSLFDKVPIGDMNEMEKSVAFYLEDQEKLLFWYRNRPKADYYIQGWRSQKVYPDFIFTITQDQNKIDKVFVTEFKGEHLLGSDDSEYKKDLLSLCTNLAKEKDFNELGLTFENIEVRYEFVEDTVWKQKLNEMIPR